ncbi:DUF418 domain-containing protein [Lysinibacillus xylanilyticus]|uniref:DUF418 domain-containing protein n=1 Tax=Lysinibacillus xylanilyticus TaxID=582475 RepID=UPI002B253D42|nr:DUF418 domain-containing protein [Lysinibacillus xylanilyticus]MEB2299756.1 DUF418 domain-containing protein [Lysinibacillus xylanilyticus]
MKQKLLPISAKERIETLDVLRGFALLGIILANIVWFLYPAYMQEDFSFKNEWTSFWNDADYTVKTILTMFVDGKFVMLFSMLFGFGMVIMQERAAAKQLNFWGIYSRRLIALFIFGCIHAYFIWFGDILTDYAILGLLLLLMHKLKPKAMLIISLTLYSLLLGSFTFGALSSDSTTTMTMSMSEESRQLMQVTIDAHQNGNIQELMDANLMERTFYTMRNGLYVLFLGNPIFFLFSNLPFLLMFLFGAAVAKKKWLHRFEEYRKGFFITWLLTLIFGGTFGWILPFLSENFSAVQYISSPLLTIFYAISLLFIYHTVKGKKVLQWLAFPGRMAFTNYIGQSIICTFLFGPFAFGVYGKLHLTTAIIIAIVIFVFQVIFSKLWLSKFRFGPLEYVWRSFTYLGINKESKNA